MRLWLDADAAPREVKEVCYKVSERLALETILVANQRLQLPVGYKYLQAVRVDGGADVADRYIAEHAVSGDVAISADIPLAAILVPNGVVVIDPRGDEYTAEVIGERLSVRNFMENLRSTGVETGGHASYSVRDKQAFANALDRVLTRALRRARSPHASPLPSGSARAMGSPGVSLAAVAGRAMFVGHACREGSMNQPGKFQDAIRTLAGSFRGELLAAGDAGYDAARAVHNGLIDKRPALIARCRGAGDIAAAIHLARAHGLEISVRGGGHNVAGRAVTEGGVMIDLSLMRGVLVDPVARTAVAEGGATWGDFNAATQQHGLATTGGVISSTGVGGLTLGGGLGWLMGRHGLAVDNLIGAEVVTADGKILTVSATAHPDLFWALRGGGGNFGVAASLAFALHPVGPEVLGGLVAHPLDRGGEMLKFYREETSKAPDDFMLFSGLLHAPDGSGHKIGAMVVFHPDPVAGAALAAPIKRFGPPIMDVIGPMPYQQVNAMLDGGFPRGALNYWKSSFLAGLPDEAIELLVSAFRACPAPLGAVMLEHFHGAVTRVAPTATAFPHRQVGFNLLIIAQWLDPAQSGESIAWARATYDAMRPFMAAGRYVNYLGDDEASDPVGAAYGPDHERLRLVKKTYDPQNTFHLNQNIRPA